MRKNEFVLLRRGLLCALVLSLAGSAAFAADSVKEAEKKEKPLSKDGQITSLSLDKKTGNTTVVVMLGTLNMPEPPKGKPGDKQPADVPAPSADKKPTADASGMDKGKMPEMIKLNGTTMDIILTKDTKLCRGMPGMGNDQMPPPQNKNMNDNGKKGDNKDNKKDNGNRQMPPEQNVKASDLKIGDILEVIYAKDGKTVESILVITPFPPIGLDGRAGPMMGMRMRRHGNHGCGCSCGCCGCGDMDMRMDDGFMMPPPPFPPMMPPCDEETDGEVPAADASADTAAM